MVEMLDYNAADIAAFGKIVFAPIKSKPDVNELFGMFSDGKLSSADFIKEKIREKDMENWIMCLFYVRNAWIP